MYSDCMHYRYKLPLFNKRNINVGYLCKILVIVVCILYTTLSCTKNMSRIF